MQICGLYFSDTFCIDVIQKLMKNARNLIIMLIPYANTHNILNIYLLVYILHIFKILYLR